MKLLLPLLVATAGCVDNDNDPYTPDCVLVVEDCYAGESTRPTAQLVLDARVTAQSNPVLAQGGVATFQLYEAGVQISSITPTTAGVTLENLGERSYRVSSSTVELATFDLVGTTNSTGAPFTAKTSVYALPVERVAVTPTTAYSPRAGMLAYMTRDVARLALGGPTDRNLVDESLIASGPGIAQTSWEHVQMPTTAGSITLHVAGGAVSPRTIQLEVVDGIDHVEAERIDDGQLCFHAYRGAHEVYVRSWTFARDGVTVTSPWANCVAHDVTDPAVVVGTAHGVSGTE